MSSASTVDDAITKIFEVDVIVMTHTKRTGLCPDFSKTMNVVSEWSESHEDRLGELVSLRILLSADIITQYDMLIEIWKDCHSIRNEFVCTKDFAAYCINRESILRKCCLLLCIHKTISHPWERMSIEFLLLVNLIRHIDLHDRINDTLATLIESTLSFGTIQSTHVTEELDYDEMDIPTNWWGEEKLERRDYGTGSILSSLLYLKKQERVPEIDIGENPTYTISSNIEMGESVCTIM